jgi:D-alanyl-D-alanine dipeptidase
MPILLADPRVSSIPVRETGDPVVPLSPLSPGVLVRRELADRLERAQQRLPRGIRLRVVEGHRSPQAQAAIIATYRAELRRRYPGADDAELARLGSRFVAPLEIAPHVAGAAVDLTLVDEHGRDLDLGTPIDATPESSAGACYFAAENIDGRAWANRIILSSVLTAEGFVNYPTEWWHWSYGDRYWALVTGAAAALYGPVPAEVAA